MELPGRVGSLGQMKRGRGLVNKTPDPVVSPRLHSPICVIACRASRAKRGSLWPAACRRCSKAGRCRRANLAQGPCRALTHGQIQRSQDPGGESRNGGCRLVLQASQQRGGPVAHVKAFVGTRAANELTLRRRRRPQIFQGGYGPLADLFLRVGTGPHERYRGFLSLGAKVRQLLGRLATLAGEASPSPAMSWRISVP